MNEKALKALEYDKIIDQLTAKASSPMGKNLCKDLKPCRDLEQIQTMQTQTKDALSRLFQKGTLSFHKVKDIRGSIKRLEIGSTLGIGELLDICSVLENTAKAKSYGRFDRETETCDSLDAMFQNLEPLTP